MTRPVADILAEAARDDWPNSSIAAMANHHLCGNARDTDSGLGAPGPESWMGGREGAVLSPRQGRTRTYREEGSMADPNCQYCGGTGSVTQTVDVGGVIIIRKLPCRC